MKKCWKEIIIVIAQLLVFYVFPLIAEPDETMGMVALSLITTFVLAVIMGIVSRKRVKYLYSILVPVLFIPSIFIYYNDSALIYIVWYFVNSLAALLIGNFIYFICSKK